MSKYFWEINVRSDENKLSYIPVLDGHPSLGPTTCLLLLFFLHTGHIAPPKIPFQNKLCCWSSLSWDSLLKNSSLLWGNTKQTLTTVSVILQKAICRSVCPYPEDKLCILRKRKKSMWCCHVQLWSLFLEICLPAVQLAIKQPKNPSESKMRQEPSDPWLAWVQSYCPEELAPCPPTPAQSSSWVSKIGVWVT